MIAFHYPPCGLSSGLQRTLSFSRDLPEYGWSPVVLTVNPRAYSEIRNDQLCEIPSTVPVRRAFALDSTRHFALRGRYLSWTALPDPYVSWLIGAIPSGLRLIRRHHPQFLWSTYPSATAHLIGLVLHRLTGIPWIADFRDPMTEIDPLTQERFPKNPGVWRARRWVEKQTLMHCSQAVFVTSGSLEIHQRRYPESVNRMRMIANGYDENNFSAAEGIVDSKDFDRSKILLLHSGVLYPGPDRDPSAFFAALAQLRLEGRISATTLHVRLRASGSETYYEKRIHQYGVEDIVSLAPPIPYRQALAEMMNADGLLVFQGRTSNPAVPAKLYEYLRAQRPIFALVDDAGSTAAVLRQAGIGTVVPLDSTTRIAEGLMDFLAQVRRGIAPIVSRENVEQYSRRFRAAELAALMNQEACRQTSPGQF